MTSMGASSLNYICDLEEQVRPVGLVANRVLRYKARRLAPPSLRVAGNTIRLAHL